MYEPKRTKRGALLLWLFGGWMGLHCFYLDNRSRGWRILWSSLISVLSLIVATVLTSDSPTGESTMGTIFLWLFLTALFATVSMVIYDGYRLARMPQRPST